MLCVGSSGRHSVLRILYPLRCAERTSQSFYSSKKDDSDSSNDEKGKRSAPHKNVKSHDAADKLQMLIRSMIKEDSSSQQDSLVEDKFAKPRRYYEKRERLIKQEAENHASQEKEVAEQRTKESPIEDAARKAAETLGGDTKKTESELLTKLLSHSAEMQQGSPEQRGSKPAVDLSELIAGMKIDRTKKPDPFAAEETSRAQQVRRILGQQPPPQAPQMPPQRTRDLSKPQLRIERVDLFGAAPLEIFKVDSTAGSQSSFNLDTWKKLEQRELRLAVTHPPKNVFEEMILWTDQGKLWKFPINNEQGLEEEAEVPFSDHVFLEHYLEPWCPKKGPVRHFMELVCVGLSKNSFVTAEEKRKHIEWYRDYFASKKDILAEVGALN